MLDPLELSDPSAMPTRDLVLHVLGVHHHYLHETMPFLRSLASRVAAIHGARAPRLRDLASIVDRLGELLTEHLRREEREVFPRMLAPEGCGTLALEALLERADAEHAEVDVLLDRMRAAADDYEVPSWACNACRTLLGELAELENDTRAHLELEDHVLFARFR
jgi:regulator of cell morphogenesis and NO signaling